MQYYRLNQTQEDKAFYFDHQGLFNFWNQYLILHWGDIHLVIINKPGTNFSNPYYATSELYNAMYHLKNDYCGDCDDIEHNMCDIVNDFGECIYMKVLHDFQLYKYRLYASSDASWLIL